MIRKEKKVKTIRWASYMSPAAKTLRQTQMAYETEKKKKYLLYGKKPLPRRQYISELPEEERESAVKERVEEREYEERQVRLEREEQKAKVMAVASGIGRETRRIVTSKKPALRYERIEGLFVRRKKPTRRVRLRYAPMSASLLEAGRESNPWR